MKTPSWIVGVMGGGRAASADVETACELGRQIARQGWILLNGGRAAGIMEASARGAAEEGGITVGVLPDETAAGASQHIRIPILTGMGSGRNIINVLSSHVVVACPGGAGTISEIALALKYRKTVILLNFELGDLFQEYRRQGRLIDAATPDDAVQQIRHILEE